MIRKFILLCSGLILYLGHAQKNVPQIKLDTVSIGKEFVVGDTVMTFKRVISDSRCPQDATCIWEGEAKVLFTYEEDGEVKAKEVTISNASTSNNNSQRYTLIPLPISTVNFEDRAYQLIVSCTNK